MPERRLEIEIQEKVRPTHVRGGETIAGSGVLLIRHDHLHIPALSELSLLPGDAQAGEGFEAQRDFRLAVLKVGPRVVSIPHLDLCLKRRRLFLAVGGELEYRYQRIALVRRVRSTSFNGIPNIDDLQIPRNDGSLRRLYDYFRQRLILFRVRFIRPHFTDHDDLCFVVDYYGSALIGFVPVDLRVNTDTRRRVFVPFE